MDNVKRICKVLKSSNEEKVNNITELSRGDNIVIDKEVEGFISGIVLKVYPNENKFDMQPIQFDGYEFQNSYPDVYEEMETLQEEEPDDISIATFNFDDINYSIYKIDNDSPYMTQAPGVMFSNESKKCNSRVVNKKITRAECLKRAEFWLNKAKNLKCNKEISGAYDAFLRIVCGTHFFHDYSDDVREYVAEVLEARCEGRSIGEITDILDYMTYDIAVYKNKEEATNDGYSPEDDEWHEVESGEIVIIP